MGRKTLLLAASIAVSCCIADLPVRDPRDSACQRLHSRPHVSRPLLGGRPSHHLHDDTQRSQHVRRSRPRLGRHRRRQRAHARRIPGAFLLHLVPLVGGVAYMVSGVRRMDEVNARWARLVL